MTNVVVEAFNTLSSWIDWQLFLEEVEPEDDHPEELLHQIVEETFVEVDWPAYQDFMEEDWWPEEVHFSEDDRGRSLVLIPTHLLIEASEQC